MLLSVRLLVMGTEVGQLITVASLSLIVNPFCLFIPKLYDRYDRKDTVRRVGAVWASRHPLEALVSPGWGLLCVYENVPAHSTTCPTVLENGFLFFFSFPEQRRL